MTKYKKREKKSTMVSGLIYLGIGLYFLGVSVDLIPWFDRSWPVFFIIVGMAVIGSSFSRRNRQTTNEDPPTVNQD